MYVFQAKHNEKARHAGYLDKVYLLHGAIWKATGRGCGWEDEGSWGLYEVVIKCIWSGGIGGYMEADQGVGWKLEVVEEDWSEELAERVD